MLLERIDIDSCGSLERVQLGPFSHRLNAVFGPPGAGKTATIEFLRSVMLGTDRHWHQGCAGRVVWASPAGLLHCRREADGTAHGRLSTDFVDRNGYSHNQLNGYRDAENYHRLNSMIDLPRLAIGTLVAPSHETTFAAMVDACRSLGLTEVEPVREDGEVMRLRACIADIDRQISEHDLSSNAAYRPQTTLDTRSLLDSRTQLQDRRRVLLDELARIERIESRLDNAASMESRRSRLEVRLSDARDEVARLRNQESDLRRSLADVERELAECTHAVPTQDNSIRIASARRLQLEELDNQLMRLGRTLREIRSIRDNWPAGDHWITSDGIASLANEAWITSDGLASLANEAPSMRYYSSDPHRTANDYYRSRLEAARRHLDWLVRHDETRTVDTTRLVVDSLDSLHLDSTYIRRADLDSMVQTIRTLIESLGRLDYKITATQIHNDHLRQCEATLSDTIRRLVEKRLALLQRIAGEHNLSVNHLSEAFGDWSQCHDQPHLYQWLLSDHFPPRAEDSVLRSARRTRLESERGELLDELSRTVNRLDDSVREVRLLEVRLRELPSEAPVLAEALRKDKVRDELSAVESRLAWLENRRRLEEERQTLTRRYESLLALRPKRTSGLQERAVYWLDQMTAGRLNHLMSDAQWQGLDSHHRMVESAELALLDRSTSPTERSLVTLALRMAAADMMGRRGTQLPLLLDDPAQGWFGSLDTTPLVSAWSRFTEAGNQLIAFTAHRGLAENVRTHGGFVQSLAPSRYYQMRYRDTWESSQPSLGHVNRELDTVWREANGFYDDPHWYRAPDVDFNQQRNIYRHPNATARPMDWADDYAPRQNFTNEYDVDSSSRVGRGPASPFFLTDASPVDQAPSIDAVAAQRLRMVGITTVGQLLSADPNRLAHRLELADVSPAVIIRWQNESNLVCGVPQLRNFDARVLVGCGFTSPAQLARMHPGRLLEKVESFLATDRGRQILRSGTSYELSRITSWIAAANRSVARESRHSGGYVREERRQRRLRTQGRSRGRSYDRSRDYDTENRQPVVRAQEPAPIVRTRESSERQPRPVREYDRAAREPRQSRDYSATGSARRKSRADVGPPRDYASSQRAVTHHSVASTQTETVQGLRFYLHRESPIVDAPSIGPKTADKMQAFGIRKVDQFLTMSAAEVANRLGNPKITSDRILAWQRQATLVCRIPMLRGHDAQLLVEAGIFEPERLSQCTPEWLLSQVDPIARSSEGKRILRGAERPDLAEVTDWIRWAKDHRSLLAA